jgi:ubiquinone/menaquinone biosynthesis C-methylase UbiE
MIDGWRSYDRVAEAYERIHAPRLAQPAADLVAMVELPPEARVLDLGTGTGVTARAARDALGAEGWVVGADPSVGMLRVAAGASEGIRFVAAEAIDLPFADGTFDAVLGSFVISHFTKYQTALYDISRVLRRDGRLAVSAWADGMDDLQRTWTELLQTVVQQELLQDAIGQALPWRDRFSDRERLEEALLGAGFRHVRTELREYRFRYSIEEYVEGLGTWATGRFVREMLGDAGWQRFQARALTTFRENFADPVNDFREVLLATCRKA